VRREIKRQREGERGSESRFRERGRTREREREKVRKREREKERKREREKDRKRERGGESVCVCERVAVVKERKGKRKKTRDLSF